MAGGKQKQPTVSTDAVAQDQIRAFDAQLVAFANEARRHPRTFQMELTDRDFLGMPIQREPRPTAGRELDDAKFWLETVAATAFAAGYGDYEPEDRRSLMIGCRLLGLSWIEVHKAINDTRRFGAERAAAYWMRYMRPGDARYVGRVYTAFAKGEPHIIKIGFSTAPAKRMKQLTRTEGREVALISSRAGTMLHEWGLHQHCRHGIADRPEWYRLEGIPGWLLAVGSEQARAA